MSSADNVDDFLREVYGDGHDKKKKDQPPPPGELDLIFEKKPVDLEQFLYGQSFLGLEPLSGRQYEFVEVGSQIYYTETLKMLGWAEVKRVTELVAQWGKSSGKDHVSMVILARVLYQLSCLKSPQNYYGMSKYSTIDVLNVAYSTEQAADVFFKPFKLMLESSNFFGKLVEGSGRHITLPKNLHAYSGHSYEEALEGKNLIICVLDEISAFKTKEEVEALQRRRMRAPRYSAEAVFDMAATSVSSRFPGVGKVLALSFPRFKGDYIQQLYEQGLNDPSVYVSLGATWEINPTKKREHFDNDYRRNPERSAARYECKPSGMVEGFFKHPDKIKAAFPRILEEDAPTLPGMFPKLRDSWKATHEFPCAAHIDLGWKVDSAGIALAHVYGTQDKLVKQGDESMVMQLPLVEVDLVTSFIASTNGEIDFTLVREFVLEIRARGFRLDLISLDGYQSVEMVQNFQKLGIETKIRSIDADSAPYDDLKTLIYESRIKGYSVPRTITRGGSTIVRYVLEDELEKLVQMFGRKVDHRVGSSKDEGDAVSGAVQGALELGYIPSGLKNQISQGGDRVAFEGMRSDRVSGDREFLSPLD